MKSKSSSTNCESAVQASTQFCRKLIFSLGKLKGRLQDKYERAHPGRGQLIRQAVAEAEELAWQTPFPHLFFPDFAEVRLAEIVAAREPALAGAA